MQRANYICYKPPKKKTLSKEEHTDLQSVVNKMKAADTPETVAELKVAVEKYKCKVVIEDKNGKKVRSLEPHSGMQGGPVITLVHEPPGDSNSTGHYNVKVNNKLVQVKSDSSDKSCMFESLAIGLSRSSKLPIYFSRAQC